MLKEAIYHKIDSDYCYALSKNKFLVKLRTKQGDVEEVNLIYFDKYKFYQDKKRYYKPMKKVASDGMFDYYEIVINLDMLAFSYLFELINKDEKIYYSNYKFFDKIPGKDISAFAKPSRAEKDIFTVPEWAKKAIVYQIFPERFNNGDKSNDHENTQDWYGGVNRESMLGGDLKGIMEKLDYLQELGINTIYLTPIFQAGSNHKYDTFDYFKVDPQFGTLETLKKLVNKAHEKGIRIILDAVFNHCGVDFFAFKDVLEKGEESEYKDWFDIRKFPVVIKDNPDYATFGYAGYMPKLMTKNPKVKEYLISIATYWIKEADIDGWRLDVADEIDHSFWREFRSAVKAVKEDALIIGEVWYDSGSWLQGDQFDSVMNYELQKAVSDYVIKDEFSPKEFEYCIGFLRRLYMMPAYYVLWNLIDSHDTPRFLYTVEGDKDKLKLAAFMQFTLPGAPMIYYGDEVGMTGAHDPDCRRGMLWDEEKQDKQLFQYYQKLIKIRKDNLPLTLGEIYTMYADENIYGFRREYEEDVLDIYVNKGDNAAALSLEADGEGVMDILSGEKYEAVNGKVNFIVSEKSGIILKNI